MCQESVYARFQRNLRAIREAEARVIRLVERFVSVAERLRDWREVGFEGTLGDYQLVTPGATYRIRIDGRHVRFEGVHENVPHSTPAGGEVVSFQELPSLKDICEARQAWNDARREVEGAINAMDERHRSIALQHYQFLERELKGRH